ncbi:MAG: hypothetical protein R6T90_03555 [Dissulfuribacterales bacterium]
MPHYNNGHLLQEVIIKPFDILDTMSPKGYQEMLVKSGGGIGRKSPGFRTFAKKKGGPLADLLKAVSGKQWEGQGVITT